MWSIIRTDSLASRLKKLEKKNGREVRAIFDNLDTYLVSLNQGVRPMQLFQHSFVHNEKKGVHAIDQSPLKKGFKTLRLYVYPDEPTRTLHVITLGDKSQQASDVNDCARYVDTLRASPPSKPVVELEKIDPANVEADESGESSDSLPH
jgi:hypothetical protein